MENLFGRKTLYAMPQELNKKSVAQILTKVMPIHYENSEEIDYLYWFYRGKQPVLTRTKEVRAEINNTVCENRSFEIVQFKIGYEFSHPLLYVSAGYAANESRATFKDNEKSEIISLNKFAQLDSKDAKDIELA